MSSYLAFYGRFGRQHGPVRHLPIAVEPAPDVVLPDWALALLQVFGYSDCQLCLSASDGYGLLQRP